MKIKQLIDELKKYSSDVDVKIISRNNHYADVAKISVEADLSTKKVNLKTGMVECKYKVVIEPTPYGQ